MGESKNNFLERGVKIAQRVGRKGEDGIAHVSLSADAAKDGKAVKKTFPANEIFDVNLAKNAAIDRKVKTTLRGWEKDIETAKQN